jgi:hypothetical protein
MIHSDAGSAAGSSRVFFEFRRASVAGTRTLMTVPLAGVDFNS